MWKFRFCSRNQYLYFFLITCLWINIACQGQSFHGQESNRSNKSDHVEQPESGEVTPIPVDLTDGIEDLQPVFADCDGDLSRSIVADLYQVPEDTRFLPDFEQMSAIKKVCLRQIDISDRDFKEGFPGVEGLVEWFGLDIRFRLLILKEGLYGFDLASDDGSILYINGDLVIDNDGQHPVEEKSGTHYLEPGFHDVRIKYFQGPRYRIALELYWTMPDKTERSYIPLGQILRPTVQ